MGSLAAISQEEIDALISIGEDQLKELQSPDAAILANTRDFVSNFANINNSGIQRAIDMARMI